MRLSRSTLTRHERGACRGLVHYQLHATIPETVTMAILVTTPTGAASQTDEDSQVSMQVSMLEKRRRSGVGRQPRPERVSVVICKVRKSTFQQESHQRQHGEFTRVNANRCSPLLIRWSIVLAVMRMSLTR